MKTLKSLKILLFLIISSFLLNGCATAFYYGSTCGRCCPESDKSVELKSSFLDDDKNLVLNFSAELAEEKEVGDYHIILNLQEIVDTLDRFFSSVKLEYESKKSDIDYLYKSRIYSKYNLLYNLDVYLNRHPINKGFFFPANGFNVTDSTKAAKYQGEILFTSPPPR